ncbi:MAG: hypothetical protein QOI98_1505 [Solirubrobacteraceae bacterium]|nr:hypothetical protein [Solirubrobacteraceae bacterium]
MSRNARASARNDPAVRRSPHSFPLVAKTARAKLRHQSRPRPAPYYFFFAFFFFATSGAFTRSDFSSGLKTSRSTFGKKRGGA